MTERVDSETGTMVSTAGVPVAWQQRRADAGLGNADEGPGKDTPRHAETAGDHLVAGVPRAMPTRLRGPSSSSCSRTDTTAWTSCVCWMPTSGCAA